MTTERRWTRRSARLAAAAVIAAGLVAASQMARSGEGTDGFDQAAAQARDRPEAQGPGAGAADHVLEGRWRVDYDDPWFTGSLVYDLREEADGLNGYLVEIVADGGVQPVPGGSLVFELRTWDGTRGTGLYYTEYDGVVYAAECDVELRPTGRLQVGYSYNGDRAEEIWTRVEDGELRSSRPIRNPGDRG